MKRVIILMLALSLFSCKKQSQTEQNISKLLSKGWYLQTSSVFKQYAYFGNDLVTIRENDMAKLCFLYDEYPSSIKGNKITTTAFGGTSVTFEFVESNILLIHTINGDLYYEGTYVKNESLDSNCAN